MSKLKRNLALIGSTAVIATFGVGGIMTAHADTSTPGTSVVQKSGVEKGEVSETSDGADQGPDANANEAGHQDANETGEAAGTETADGAEGAESATETSDGADQGPDANPNEPGHQDANETGESQ